MSREMKITDYFSTRVKRPRSPSSIKQQKDFMVAGTSNRSSSPVKELTGTFNFDQITEPKNKKLKKDASKRVTVTLRRQVRKVNIEALPTPCQAPSTPTKTPTKRTVPESTKVLGSPSKEVMDKLGSPSSYARKILNASVKANEEVAKMRARIRGRVLQIPDDAPPADLAPKPIPKETARSRFAHLLLKDPPVQTLKKPADKPKDEDLDSPLGLPLHYKKLLETFRATDTILSMYISRSTTCTFDKLKKAVEEMNKRQFTKHSLAQILTVQPECYRCYYEEGRQLEKREAQLIVALPFDVTATKFINPTFLVERRKGFHERLINLVKKEHHKFLQSLEPPVTVNDQDLRRWHPSFRLDKVEPIVPAENALPPEPRSENKCESAQHILNKKNDKNSETSDQTNVSSPSKNPPSSPSKVEKGVLKGVSSLLLQKIRAKEAASIARSLTRKPEVEKKLKLIKKLPQFITTIHSVFISEKRASLPYDLLIEKVNHSFSTQMAITEIAEHIELLVELFPDWVYKISNSKGLFIKMDRNKSLKDLQQRLDQHEKRLKGGH